MPARNARRSWASTAAPCRASRGLTSRSAGALWLLLPEQAVSSDRPRRKIPNTATATRPRAGDPGVGGGGGVRDDTVAGSPSAESIGLVERRALVRAAAGERTISR